MHLIAKKMLVLVVGLLPASYSKNRLLSMLGHSIHRDAAINPILVIGGTRIHACAGSSVGSLTVFRNVDVYLGEGATVGQLNWISSAPFLMESARGSKSGRLSLDDHAAIMNRHYVDASGGVSLGAYSILAGVRSTLMTHGIDVNDNVLDTEEIRIGAYAMVGGNCNFVLGAVVPPYSIVAMGSTVVRGLSDPNGFYAGVPAKFKKTIEGGDFFSRTVGSVAPRSPGEQR